MLFSSPLFFATYGILELMRTVGLALSLTSCNTWESLA